MASKKDHDYFAMCVEAVAYSAQAAELLHEDFLSFESATLPEHIEGMHKIEHEADLAKHTMLGMLMKEFITPIDREDIMELANAIDDVTDCIEDVLQRLYMFNIQAVREDAAAFTGVISRCCSALKNLLQEFGNFRKSKTIRQLIIEINHMEEEGDKLYTEATHRLYSDKDASPVEIIAWTTLYDRLEKCCDSCEDVADVVERVILKNS